MLTAFLSISRSLSSRSSRFARGATWNGFTTRLKENCTNLALICYDPHHLQGLYGLFGHVNHAPADPSHPHAIKSPTMIGDTPQFHEVLNLANRYGMHDITVLITGETGTGKEVMAQYIHSHGPRADKPFVGC